MKDLRVRPGKKVRLKDWDPASTSLFDGDKEAAQKELDALTKRLGELQHVLYAEGKHKILVVLQALDTAGKDGVIRHVFDDVNPQGVRVANFKTPSTAELKKDYLWRVHQHVPGKGEITIFNRSHYEDVLFVRIHNLVPKDVWKKRYEQINDFERMLADEGTTILKFYLHISKEEQKRRLQARLDDPEKRWKFNPGDLEERKLWGDYQEAYEEAISKTSTAYAPWHVIPADKKWYRNWAVASILVDALEGLKLRYPEPKVGKSVRIK